MDSPSSRPTEEQIRQALADLRKFIDQERAVPGQFAGSIESRVAYAMEWAISWAVGDANVNRDPLETAKDVGRLIRDLRIK